MGYYGYSLSVTWQSAWGSLLSGLFSFSSFVISFYFLALKAPKFRVSRERITALRFFDAYSAYKNVIKGVDKEKNLAKAKAALGSIVERLETSEQEPTRWAILNSERKKISQIGEEIRTRLIPAMNEVKTQSGSEHVGMVLVNLALFLRSFFREHIKSSATNSAIASCRRFHNGTPCCEGNLWQSNHRLRDNCRPYNRWISAIGSNGRVEGPRGRNTVFRTCHCITRCIRSCQCYCPKV